MLNPADGKCTIGPSPWVAEGYCVMMDYNNTMVYAGSLRDSPYPMPNVVTHMSIKDFQEFIKDIPDSEKERVWMQ